MAGYLGGFADNGDFAFAEPGQARSFSEVLKDQTAGYLSWGTLPATDGGIVDIITDSGDARRKFGEVVDAANDQTRYVNNLYAAEDARDRAYSDMIERAYQLTGVRLTHPASLGQIDGWRRDNASWGGGGDIERYRDWADAKFQRELTDLRRNNREVARDLSFSPDASARGVAQAAELNAATAGEGLNPALQLSAGLAGGMQGGMYDPIFMASMAVGPSGGVGRTVLGRIGSAAVTQGLFNAGMTVLSQPAVQAWRREAGLRNGVEPAMEEVAMAFLMGAIPGAVVQGGVEVLRPALSRVAAGTATPDDYRALTEALAPDAAGEVEGALVQAQARDPADAALAAERPPGVTAADHEATVAQAVRKAVDDELPPPELPVAIERERPELASLSDRSPMPEAGRLPDIDGKPVSAARFDAATLVTDPAAFQFKGGADAAGVNGRLAANTGWDPAQGSRVIVFERADGTRLIADGHQRLGLAQRLLAEGKEDAIALEGVLFREADGWAPEDVRALAARKNMQEGAASPLDAARELRRRPGLLDDGLPVSSEGMKQAIGLARLSDGAFAMVEAGAVPADIAAAVGRLAPDPATHAGALADLARLKPESEPEARRIIADALAGGQSSADRIRSAGAPEMAEARLAAPRTVEPGTADALEAAGMPRQADVAPVADDLLEPDAAPDLFDAVPVAPDADGKATQFVSLKAALDDIARIDDAADLIRACKV